MLSHNNIRPVIQRFLWGKPWKKKKKKPELCEEAGVPLMEFLVNTKWKLFCIKCTFIKESWNGCELVLFFWVSFQQQAQCENSNLMFYTSTIRSWFIKKYLLPNVIGLRTFMFLHNIYFRSLISFPILRFVTEMEDARLQYFNKKC